MDTEKKARSPRVMVVDAVRGAAVLCMMQWHCADAWIGGDLREGAAHGFSRIVGGLAAPLFLLLAGLSAALVFQPGRALAGARRGATIVIGGYAFKLFAWTVDYGAIVERCNWPVIVLDAATLALAWRAVAEGTDTRRRWGAAALATLTWAGTWLMLGDATRTPSVIARLDVLQGIGAALIVTNGILAILTRTRHAPWLLAIAAFAVALATPSFYGISTGPLPMRLVDYVARTATGTELSASGARFPLFPWLGYALLGAAVGRSLRARPLADAWEVPFVKHGALAVAISLVIGAAVFEPMPVAQWILARSEQTRNSIRLVFNADVALGLAGLGSLVLPRAAAIERAVLSLGRHSLIVYVVHLELAFGLLVSPLRQTMGWPAWALGTSLMLAAMIALSFALDRRDERRRSAASAPSAA